MALTVTVILSVGLSWLITLIGTILHLRQVDKMLYTYMENLERVHEEFFEKCQLKQFT